MRHNRDDRNPFLIPPEEELLEFEDTDPEDRHPRLLRLTPAWSGFYLALLDGQLIPGIWRLEEALSAEDLLTAELSNIDRRLDRYRNSISRRWNDRMRVRARQGHRMTVEIDCYLWSDEKREWKEGRDVLL
jgi:hypothetical protein